MTRTYKLEVLEAIADELAKASNGTITPKIIPYERGDDTCNCWGFVAHAANWVDEPDWMEQRDMKALLDSKTFEVSLKEALPGDILAYFAPGTDYLLHTALVVRPGELILHKAGIFPISIEGEKDEPYYQPSKMSYLRVKA